MVTTDFSAGPKKPDPLPVTAVSYSIDRAAAASGLSRALLYRLEKEGRIRFIRVGGRTVVTAADLAALIESYRTDSRPGRRPGRKRVEPDAGGEAA